MNEQSEVAHLLTQIASRDEAAQRGMSEFAATAKHRSISARANRVSALVERGDYEEAFRCWHGGASAGEMMQ